MYVLESYHAMWNCITGFMGKLCLGEQYSKTISDVKKKMRT